MENITSAFKVESNALLNETINVTGNLTCCRPLPHQVSTLMRPETSIPLYSVIFVLSIVGNILVILTLVRNKRMRTVTNIYLLNLAISDLLLSVLCMPFSLVPMLMNEFIFGAFMCVLVRYLQAVSVGASCYTLVAISLERYFAIMYPLTSRRWQTLSHARKMILVIWLTTLLVMSPIAAFQQLLTLKNGKKACREIWPSGLSKISLDKAYSVLLVVLLLLVPLLLMCIFYGIVAKKLWVDIGKPLDSEPSRKVQNGVCIKLQAGSSSQVSERNILVVRQVNFAKDLINRKRVIRMLFVIVVQYFICWSPVYVVNTWKTMDYPSLHDIMSSTTWSLILLLAYTSSFVHPITYCFMNKSFRRAFVRLFCCAPKDVKIVYRSKPSSSRTYIQEKY